MAEKIATTEKETLSRPPIIVVMGHVDHGKTTLLDHIRKTTVAAREAGGITQSIGAYEIEHKGKKITFIDTPGHEAFSQMRARGATVADLAILIVAADDGVQPQTKESIQILKETKTPFVVAINKIDKPNADIEKTKNDLMQNEVFLEGFGGNISWQKIAAKSGEGISELLDLVLLSAEIENFTYNPAVNACGFIIEAKMDSRRGITAVAIIKDGILLSGKNIATPSACGKIKILENFKGERVDKLEPSAPALILGFNNLPEIGEEFIGGDIELTKVEKSHSPAIIVEPKMDVMVNGVKKPSLNLILKADVSGSLEAFLQVVKNIPQNTVKIDILSVSVGEITDGDIKTAISSNAIVAGFNTKSNKAAETLARAQNIKILTSQIIYELVKAIEGEIKAIEIPPPIGELEVLAKFSQKGNEQLIGGKVLNGIIKKNANVKIIRDNEEVGTARVANLKLFKQEVASVLPPKECGLIVISGNEILIGDHLVCRV